jgi:hypothetical protein
MRAPLDKLHDFYQPQSPSWRPQTIGWYAVFAIAALALLWCTVHLIRRRRKNRYRREALNELAQVEAAQLSGLLKRTALAVWPREQIASLSGAAWLKFLDSSVDEPLFRNSPENCLEEAALSGQQLPIEDESALRNAAGAWIRRHKAPRQPRRPRVSA